MVKWKIVQSTIQWNFTLFIFCKILQYPSLIKIIPIYVIFHLEFVNLWGSFTYKYLSSPLWWKLKQNFVFSLLKLILNIFSVSLVLSLMPWVWPSLNTKKLFFRLSVWDDKLLSTPKITTFLAKSLPNLHEPCSINIIKFTFYWVSY